MDARRQRKQRRRALAIALAFVAATALIVGSLGKRWLTTPDAKAGIGLLEIEKCDGGGCDTISNDDVVKEIEKRIALVTEANKKLPPKEQMSLPHPAWDGWPVVGLITFITSLLAAVGLLVGAGLALAGKRPELPVMPTTAAVLGLLVAIITGCLFIATKPAEVMDMGVGWSFMTFGGGIVLGLASVFPLNRAIRPIDEELGEASATMSWGESRDDAP